jgi:hypothetical protein
VVDVPAVRGLDQLRQRPLHRADYTPPRRGGRPEHWLQTMRDDQPSLAVGRLIDCAGDSCK